MHVHVKDKRTGHEYVIREHLFDSEVHTKTNKPTHDVHGDLVPVKFKTTVAKSAGKKSGTRKPASSGQRAETEKE